MNELLVWHLKLSYRDVQYLHDLLENTQDEGPDGAGWKSDQLRRIIDAIENLEEYYE